MGQGGFGRFVAVGVLFTVALVWASCGTSNDQGISFRALAWVVPDEGGEVDLEDPTFDQGTIFALGCSDFTPIQFKLVVLENVMAQGINVQRVDLQYRIPGGALNLPPTAWPGGIRLGPASGSEGTGVNLGAAKGFLRADPLTPQQADFLNQNRNKLPDLPFRLIVIATGIGVADNGDVFETNEITYPVDLVDDEAFCGPDVNPPTEPGQDPPVVNPTPTAVPIDEP